MFLFNHQYFISFNYHRRSLSASAVVIHYEEALYQVYAPLPLPLSPMTSSFVPLLHFITVKL